MNSRFCLYHATRYKDWGVHWSLHKAGLGENGAGILWVAYSYTESSNIETTTPCSLCNSPCLLTQSVADGGVGGHELEDGVAEEASNGSSHPSLRATRRVANGIDDTGESPTTADSSSGHGEA